MCGLWILFYLDLAKAFNIIQAQAYCASQSAVIVHKLDSMIVKFNQHGLLDLDCRGGE